MIYSIIALLTFIFWIWMLVDCIKNGGLSSNQRIVWVIVIVLLYALGGLIYYFAGRGKSGA